MELTLTTPHESNKSIAIDPQCYNASAQLYATPNGSKNWRSVASASRLWDSSCVIYKKYRPLHCGLLQLVSGSNNYKSIK